MDGEKVPSYGVSCFEPNTDPTLYIALVLYVEMPERLLFVTAHLNPTAIVGSESALRYVTVFDRGGVGGRVGSGDRGFEDEYHPGMANQGKQLSNDPLLGYIRIVQLPRIITTGLHRLFHCFPVKAQALLDLLLFQMRPFVRHPGTFFLLLRGARPLAPHSVALLRNFSPLRFSPRPDRLLIPHAAAAAAFSASSGASASSTASRDRSSRNTLVYLFGLVAAMVGASYAAVPLYRRFCQATGYGGTVQRREGEENEVSSPHGNEVTSELVVQFNADVADGMQWKFTPTQREVFFYIDPEFETDPKMDGINNIILSYTFFKVKD
ncbi:hypothetical protein BHM03_00007797 [Ensete ventricosum]|nr:hypothetical protein BHM03_00007797 [Ensete ventricosum]